MTENPECNHPKLILPVCSAVMLVIGIAASMTCDQRRPVLAAGQAQAPVAERPLEARRVTAADLFPTGILWVGLVAPTDQETLALAEAVREQAPAPEGDLVSRTEDFIVAWPNSSYVPSLHSQLGQYYRRTGRLSNSLEHWEKAWLATGRSRDAAGKQIGDETLAPWALLLASLGQVETLDLLFREHGDRVFENASLASIWLRAREKYGRMVHRPERSFKCGIFALDLVGQTLGLKNYDRDSLLDTLSKPHGFSLTELELLSIRYELGLKAVRRPVLDQIPVPSLIHWKQNHYAAIVEHQDGWFKVNDPTNGGEVWMAAQEIAEEATGYFLIPANLLGQGWMPVGALEGGQVFGKASPCPPDDREDGALSDPCLPPGRGGGGFGSGAGGGPGQSSSGCGMVVWRVTEPYLNLWLDDMPLSYSPSRGPKVELALSFRQRAQETIIYLDIYGGTSFGQGWHSSWVGWANGGQAYLPGGVRDNYTFPIGSDLSNPSYHTNCRQEILRDGPGNVIGYAVHFPDGSQLRYTFATGSQYTSYYLKEKIDVQGDKLIFNYDAQKRISSIQDADNQYTYLYYNDPNNAYRATRVVAPGSREVLFGYDAGGHLTSITDVVGILSTLVYDIDHIPASLTTPYGTTTFAWAAGIFGTVSYVDRKLVITEPGNQPQVYAMIDVYGGTDIPAFSSSQLPINTPRAIAGHPYGTLETVNRSERNTFYWNRQQVAAMGRTDVENFNWSQLKRGRGRHWVINSAYHIDTLNHEQAPSPDGTVEGQITWFDYDGKDYAAKQIAGTQILPRVIARPIPGISSSYPWFESYPRNTLGHPTAQTSTYTRTDGAWGTRTKSYTYAANGIDLLSETDFNGAMVREYTWNTKHQVLTRKEHPESAVTYQASYTYDSLGRLSTLAYPAGLLSTHTYGTDNRLSKIENSISGAILRSEQFTWLDGNLRTHTDALGLQRTVTFDKLNRILRIDYSSDLTYEELRYTVGGLVTGAKRLDAAWRRDRLGKITTYGYNGLRQLTSETDPLNRTTTYQYCSCDAVEAITDALVKTTSFGYDQAGRRTSIIYPDSGGTISFAYNLLGQLASQSDSLGSKTFEYNNQGLRTRAKNHSGNPEETVLYDINDNRLTVTDANGTSLNHTFDWLGRIKTRTWPSAAVESFSYSDRGLTGHTDQLSKTSSFAYDAALRKTSATTPNSEAISYTYDAADNLKTLTDARGKTTTWTYDVEGRLTSKQYQGQTFTNWTCAYNANSWVTSRRFYSSSTSYKQTSYSYDDAGNLTLVDYPTGTTDFAYGYDAVNRLTSMSDGAGTTAFTYTGSGQLATEDGPWASDTITYGYNSARERSSLSLGQPTGTWAQTYSYDGAHRLTALTASSVSGTAFSYTYSSGGTPAAASRLWIQLNLPNTSKITRSFDTQGRLTSAQLKNSGNAVLNKHDYLYDNRHARTRHTRTDASYVDLTYDNLGQLKSGLGSGGQSTENLSFNYDTGWNMSSRTSSGLPITYTINDRNQVTGDGTLTYSYDAHGNLISRSDNRLFTYDPENRLTAWEYYQLGRTEFVYDGLARVRLQRAYTWNGGAGVWVLSGETRYIYDGRRVIQERNSANTPVVGYTRGLDLAGSLEGAGGIGGLLARSHGYSSGSWATHHNYQSDGGGNITAMLDSSQAISATYKYDPYGRTLSSSGTMASANLYRFSSKEIHGDSGMYSYGFRFYEPNLQRWLNRDPLGEEGGVNLYQFARNDAVNYVDPDGLTGWALNCPQAYWDSNYRRMVHSPEYQEGFKRGMGQGAMATLLIAASLTPIPGDELGVAGWFAGRVGKCLSKLRPAARLSKEAEKSIRSLEKQIAKHEEKLAEFKANPTIRPGMENLPKDVIRQQQQRRIQHLETEIQTFRNNIDKIRRGEL